MTPTEPVVSHEARVRGSLVSARLAFVSSRLGEPWRDALLDALPPEDARRMRSVAIDGDWFAFSLLADVDRRIEEALGASTPSLAADVGTFSAEQHHRQVSRQIGTLPADQLAERFGRLSPQLLDVGPFEFAPAGDVGENHGSSYRFATRHPFTPFFCQSMVAYYARSLELLGLRVISSAEAECVARGGRGHRFEIWWSPTQLAEPAIDPRTSRVLKEVAAADPRRPMTGRRWGAQAEPARRPGRTVLLVVLAVALVAYWAATDGYRLVFPPERSAGSPPAERVLRYQCSGSYEAEVTFDRPELRVRTKEGLRDARVVADVEGRWFGRSLDALSANGSYVLGLPTFRDESGAPPPSSAAPVRVRIDGTGAGGARRCDCVPE